MSTVWIRVAYAAVIGVLVAFTVVFGIAMVAPGPKPPGDPGITFRQLSSDDSSGSNRTQNTLQQQIESFYGDAAKYRGDYPKYQRNVFLAATGLGILFVLIGLALPAAVNYLRLGLVGGGLLVFIYAFQVAVREVPAVTPQGSNLLSLVGAGFPDPINFAGRFARFAVSFIGLILGLFLGLWRLTEWPTGRRPMAVQPGMPPAPAGFGVGSPSSPWAPAATPAAAPSPAPVSTPSTTDTGVAEPRPSEPGPTVEWRRPE